MQNKKRVWSWCVGLALLAGCHAAPEQQLTGADRDSRGCIGSAGYIWSEARQSCLRVWEEGIRLTAPGTDAACLVVLSADGTRAELFLPVKTKPVLLQRGFTPQGPYWSRPAADWRLERLPQGWNLWHNGELAYQAPNPADD